MLAFFPITQLFSVYCLYFLFMWMEFLEHYVHLRIYEKLLLVLKQLGSREIDKFKLLSE